MRSSENIQRRLQKMLSQLFTQDVMKLKSCNETSISLCFDDKLIVYYKEIENSKYQSSYLRIKVNYTDRNTSKKQTSQQRFCDGVCLRSNKHGDIFHIF